MSIKSKIWIVKAAPAAFFLWMALLAAMYGNDDARAAPTVVPTKLAWDLTTDPTVAGFKVYSFAPGGNGGRMEGAIANPVATEWGFPAATPFTSTKCFRVTSFTANDQYESAYSDEACADFFVLPQPPKNVRVR